ncbi:MAG: C10 family peptidase [Muribaculaceae bacterium]|nr:C10 family peptidase [Muribaculaceae bacterium]
MMYKNGSSGATSVSVPIALKEYFDYSENTRILYRQFFGIDYWENMLRTELDAGCPIYYSGSASGGGHAFVFDGYDTDGFFHINWGWGGRSNGYFVVTMLNPLDQGIGSFSGGYNSTQQAVVGIRPEDGELEAYSFDAFYAIFSPSATSVALGETAQFAGKPAMLGAASWKQLRWGVVILNADETQIVLGPEYFDASECKVGYYYNATFEIDLPADLPEGQYHAKLVYTVDDEPYHFFGNAPDVHAFVLMEVRDGVAYFSVSDESQLSLVSLEPNSTTLYAGQSVQIAATVHNAGVEYYGNLSLVFLKNGVVGNSENIGVDIAQGSDYSFTTRLSVPTATGTYALALRDDDAQQIGSAVTVTVLPSTDCALSIASPLVAASEMPANDIQASVNLMNTGGAFMGVIEMMVLPADTLLINSIIESEVVTIPQNEKVTVNFKGSFGGLIGKGYRLWLRNPNPDKTNAYYLWGKPASFIVSKPATSLRDGDVNGDGEVDVSDANVVLNIVLGKASSGDYPGVADVSGDGVIDVADVNKLINLILNKR